MDLSSVEAMLKDRENRPEELIEVLQDIQGEYKFIPEEAMCMVSEVLTVPLIEVFRVANFYKAFSLTPLGRHLLTVCQGTACHVRGAPRFVDEVEGVLGISPGETTSDHAFTVETVNCVGCCALGPIVIIDGEYHEHMSPNKLRKLIKTIREKDAEVAASA